jgi:hypothetical protein
MGHFQLDSPATSERIRMLCQDEFTAKVGHKPSLSLVEWKLIGNISSNIIVIVICVQIGATQPPKQAGSRPWNIDPYGLE